jgi:hypothetical protein
MVYVTRLKRRAVATASSPVEQIKPFLGFL